jgi:hypothetical protein
MKTQKQAQRQAPKQVQKQSPKKLQKGKPSLFERLNLFLDGKHQIVLGIILALSALFSFLLFDAKINMMGDDAEYLLFGYNFASDFTFPTYRGPLYPILLSPFIAIFGINIVLLKVLSAIMVTGSLFFMYKAFYGRTPALLLFPCLLLLAINSFVLFYASAILSEPLFLFIQSLLLFFFCKYFVDSEKDVPLRKQLLPLLLIAVLVLCLTLTRTVGYAAVGAIAVYFLFAKQWKRAALSVAAHGLVFGLFELLKKLLWPASGSAYGLSSFFTKDMYNPDKGMEDVGGIIVRVFENVQTYLSRYVYQFSGLRADIGKPSILITVVIVLAFLWGGYMVFRKNKPLFFLALHTLAFCLANFIILHAYWMQERFIIVYFPLILFVVIAGIYYLLQGNKKVHFLYLAVVAVFFVGSFKQTLAKTEANTTALKMYLKGNTLYGLSPDWQNYIQASQRAAKEIPASENIAVRKPGTSTIYANRPFYGVYSVPSVSKDTLLRWTPAPGKAVFIMDVSSMEIPDIAPHLAFVAFGQMKIKETTTQVAGIYEIDADNKALINFLLTNGQMACIQDYEQFRNNFLETSDNLLYAPEIMFNTLKKANVHYMLLASLRINANANTGQIINTMHRYLRIMQYKYPGMAVEKFSVGTEEPATLMELIY